MILRRCMKYDSRQGLRRTGIALFAVIAITAVITGMFFTIVSSYLDYKGVPLDAVSLGDVLFYLFHGEVSYRPDYNDRFILPAVWFLLMGWLHFLLGSYPVQDLHAYGQQVFIRMEKKGYWWISKCFWSAETVLLFYFALTATACVCCRFMGFCLEFSFNAELGNWMYLGSVPDNLSLSPHILFHTVLVYPVLVSLTLGICQLAIALYVGPFISYIVLMVYLYLAVYFTKPFFIGNYAMTLRNRWVIPIENNSVDPAWCLPLCAFLALAAFLAGFLRIRKYDILASREED